MTEIDKMFENAGIKKCNRMLPCPFENQCKDCEYNWYPDFTAEKQLELIKWIAKLDGHFEISCTYNEEGYSFVFYFNRKTEKHKNPTFPYSIMNGSDFVELLAKQINNIWQDLTDQEKEEIRNILNA